MCLRQAITSGSATGITAFMTISFANRANRTSLYRRDGAAVHSDAAGRTRDRRALSCYEESMRIARQP